MFDLPTETPKNRKDYSKFVKFLKKSGFIMYQKSIYMKLSINESGVKSITESIKKNVPPEGVVSMLTVTEKQFTSIAYFLGDFVSDVVNTDDRVVEI